MTRVSILYPNHYGSWFDVSYYLERHVPLTVKLLGAHRGFKGATVDLGLRGEIPGTRPAYIAMCHLLFTSVENFVAIHAPNAVALYGDARNFTHTRPSIQFSESIIIC